MLMRPAKISPIHPQTKRLKKKQRLKEMRIVLRGIIRCSFTSKRVLIAPLLLLSLLHFQMQTQTIHLNQTEPNLSVDYKGNRCNLLLALLTCGF